MEHARINLLDWIATSLAARNTLLTSKFEAAYGKKIFSHPADTVSLNPGDQISLLALLGNQLEMDDVHKTSILHPGPVICPVALVISLQTKANFSEMLAAIVAGYETTIRIGRAIGLSHYRYFHNTSSCGSFGAATAAAVLLKLSKEQWSWALGNAGTRTGGLWQLRNETVDSKSLHNLQASYLGWQAAHLAQNKISGPKYILEGPQGVFSALSEDPKPQLVYQVENDWLIHQVSIKPWPACRHAHAAIDCTQALLNEIDPQDLKKIAKIEVESYRDAVTFCDRQSPTTETQAKFSIQHAIAVLIVQGGLELNDFTPQKIHDPAISEWRQKIHIKEAEEFENLYPQHYGAKVTLFFNHSKAVSKAYSDAWGDPENPLSQKQVIEKAQSLMTFGEIKTSYQQRIIDRVLNARLGDKVSQLWEALNVIDH